MIYQLPNGRIIEMSLDQYLDMTEQELKDLNGLGNEYSSSITDPFYKSAMAKNVKQKYDPQLDDSNDYEPKLTEIRDQEKLNDEDYHRDDI